MSLIMSAIGVPLGYIMWACYKLVNNYGIAIILFTLITKLILFPVAIKIQKNSIKMVKMKPMVEALKKQYPNKEDKEAFMDAQMQLYAEEKYSPAAGCLPMLIQLPIIFGLIDVIYKPLNHLLHLSSETIAALEIKTLDILRLDNLGITAQLKIIKTVNDPAYTNSFYSLSSTSGSKFELIIEKIQNMDFNFLGLDLSSVPSISSPGMLLVIPLLSGLSALTLSVLQNRGGNVLQAEQSKMSRLGMTIFLTAFSLYFAFLVPAGIGLYWIASNIFAIAQMYILNMLYDPSRYIDYEALEQMKKEKKEHKEKQKGEKDIKNTSPRKREKEDYKKFFKTKGKQLVFYSEGSGFYKYFENVIVELLNKSDITIHYVTSDPNDAIFNKNTSRIVPYYIGRNRLIPFMMKMDADMVVMTMPDLQQMHIKRSLVRDDVEYVYMFHAPLSFIMTIRHGALDHYDTIFATGAHQVLEIRESEKIYQLKEKKIIECGYGVIDNMRKHYLDNKDTYSKKDKKSIVIAPSWQPDNILDSCLDDLLNSLLGKGWNVTVRPHPEYVKRFGARMDGILERYKDHPKSGELTIETDFSSNETIYSADILITDWSWIAYEYSLSTKRPSLFINTEMKIANPNYNKLSLTPLNLSLRSRIGFQLEKQEVNLADKAIESLLLRTEEYELIIDEIVSKYLFNLGKSGKAGADYIIETLKQKKD